MADKGKIKMISNLTLNSVLHVSNLTYNLLSIGKLTQDLHIYVIFTTIGCMFQDSLMEKKIGHAELRDGLYYLDTSWEEDYPKPQGLVTISPKINKILLGIDVLATPLA